MPMIKVTNETMELIRANVLVGHEFRQNATRLPDGRWDVPVSRETYQRLLDFQIPGETFDQVIQRACRIGLGRRPN